MTLALGWIDLLVAGMAAGALLFATGRMLRPRLLMLLALLPLAVVYSLGADNRVYSYHGFLHLGVVYQILEGGLPAANPLMAGEPFRFNWGAHALVALAARSLGAPPAWTFAALNGLALAVCVAFLFRFGERVLGDRRAAAYGVAVGMFAFSVTPLLARFSDAPAWFEIAGVPPVAKFTNLNAMPLGIAGFAVFLEAGARIVTDLRDRAALARLGAAFFAMAFFYPVVFAGALAGGGAALVLLLSCRNEVPGARIFAAAAAAALGSLFAVPVLVATGLMGGESALALASPLHAAVFAVNFGVLVLPVAALLLFARSRVGERARSARAPMLLCAGVVVANALVSIFTQGPVTPGIEYKFRMLAFIPIGIAGGLGIEALRGRSGLAAWCVLALLLVPIANTLRFNATRGGVLDPFYEDGLALRHADPREDELHRFLLAETPRESAIVDSHLSIPVFARRALFVGLNDRSQRSHGTRFHDGWLLDPEEVVPALVGGDARERVAAARAVLAGRDADAAGRRLAELARESGLLHVYVIARTPDLARRLEASDRFRVVFRNAAATVFRLAPG